LQSNWIEEAEKIMGYTFKNKSLIIRAFTHSSYANEHKNFPDYERLEFLGDAVLGFIMSVYLYNYFPNMNEGELTKKRAGIVGEIALSKVIENLQLNRFLRVGAGNLNDNITNSRAVKCDLFEAITGAILLDCDMDITEAKNFVLSNLEKLINIDIIDYKSKLLEELIKKNVQYSFIITEENQMFRAVLEIDGEKVCEGSGKTKKAAEKLASKNYFTCAK
jgi:ribonuclease-3